MKLFKKFKRYPLGLVILTSLIVIALFLFFEYKITKNQFGAPLDDVYIHFQFSKNLAEGNGFSFNKGQPTPGSTSPAWTILITIPYLIFKNHLLIAKTLSAIFYIFTGITTYFLGLEITKSKKLALLASIFTLMTGRLAWSALSGMEVTLFTFLLTLFVLLHLKRKNQYLLSLILGIASTVRPEGYLIFCFFFILEVIQLIQSFRSSQSFQSSRSIRSLIISCLIYLSIIAPYLLFSYSTTGNLLPNTFLAQSTQAYSLFFKAKLGGLYILRFSYLLIIDNPIIALAIPFGIISLFRRGPSAVSRKPQAASLALISIGFPIIASITAPNLRHHGRYIIPLIPLYVVIGLLGIKKLLSLIQNKLKFPILTIGTSILLVMAYLAIMLLNWASTFGWNTKNINDVHVHLGNWIKENTPKDSVIALNDIGAITYISQREIIDMIGLVSPDVLEVTGGLSKQEREAPLWEFLQEKQPDYLIIFPVWYPQISQKEELEEIYRVKLDRYTIIDGEMVVYKFGTR